ncbi:zinc-finger domain-containing protein [Parapedomonas caeni]
MSTAAPETLYVQTQQVACDGDGGALGHPRVFLKMDERGYVECGYCDRRYVLAGGPADPRPAGSADASRAA